MSVASMVDAKLVREKAQNVAQLLQVAPGQPPPTTQPPPAPVGVPTNIVNQVTRFFPTEAITLYVAYLAILGALTAPAGERLCQLSYTSRWAGVAVGALFNALLALGLTYGKAGQSQQPFCWPIFEMLTAPVAFVAWALALPDTPLLDICGYNTAIGAFLVLLVTIGLALIASVLGKNPSYEKLLSG